METNRIVNIRYVIDGMRFDAAVDINNWLHHYLTINPTIICVELYNLDHPSWDVKVIKITNEDMNIKGDINEPNSLICHTFVDFDIIVKETKKWIKENIR